MSFNGLEKRKKMSTETGDSLEDYFLETRGKSTVSNTITPLCVRNKSLTESKDKRRCFQTYKVEKFHQEIEGQQDFDCGGGGI